MTLRHWPSEALGATSAARSRIRSSERLARQLRGALRGARDAERGREAEQLAREIGAQVGVVEEGDVRVRAVPPRDVEVMQHEREVGGAREHGLVDEVAEPLDRILGRRESRRQLGEILVADGRGAQRQEAARSPGSACDARIEIATSRGSRPTTTYVTSGCNGRPSSGVCVLMKRRWVWAA